MSKWLDGFGTILTQFQIGIGGTGLRRLRFRNGFNGDLEWNPTANRVITLPNETGTVSLIESAIATDTGTSNKVIKTNSLGLLDASLLPSIGARVYHSVDQSIANNTSVALAFNTENNDSDTIHDNVTNNSRLTCKTVGNYIIGGNVEFAANATGIRQVSILVNGAVTIASQRVPAQSAASIISIAAQYTFAVNDYVQLMVYQNSGGSLNVNSSSRYSPEFFMHLIGSA